MSPANPVPAAEERYPFGLQVVEPGRVEVWVRVHVAETDEAARAWLVANGMRPTWDPPPSAFVPGEPTSIMSGTISPPAVAPMR